ITPQIADIAAIHNLYGAPSSANAGDTVYGLNGNSGTYLDGAHDLSNPISYSVLDTNGTDVFDFSFSSAHQVMDLRQETFSDLDGRDGNVGIARGTVIEIGRTGGGDDRITGNDADNEISAGTGTDTILGGGGDDAILGGGGNDSLHGGEGIDLIEGGSGNNVLNGDGGSDLIVGDDVKLAMLTMLYPTWTPPADAEVRLDNGNYLSLWEDIIDELNIV
ncbi:MAG: M10 family metallopeptidase C-terminal domain-containing protein, partial [Pseudomonadota bacterium]